MLRKTKNLSRTEVAALIDAIRQGGRAGEAAKDRLVRENMGIVSILAKKYCGNGVEYDDLIQEGILGLLLSIARFDPGRGFKFTTYATFWIRAKIIRAIEYSPMIRPSSVLRDKARSVRALVQQWNGLHSRELTRKELADLCGMTVEKLEVLQLCLQTPLSLDVHTVINGCETDHTLADLVADPSAECPFQWAEKAQLRALVKAALVRLPPRECDIVRRWIDGETYSQIGSSYGLTRERIRQILLKALDTIRKCRFNSDLHTMWAA